MCALSNGLGLPTAAAWLCRFLKLSSQNRKVVEMETKNHSSESKLEQFLVQFAVRFPVMMKVSHLNILMHLIFSQATGKLLQQICDHLVTPEFHLRCAVRYRAAAKPKCFMLKAEDATVGAGAANRWHCRAR